MHEKPTQEVINAIENSLTSPIRRMQFYESDMNTEWNPEGTRESRLIEGSVSVDYNRDERRSFELVLDNTDGALRSDPYDGLWYDKVIKIWRGLKYTVPRIPPKIGILATNEDPTTANQLKLILQRLGFTQCFIIHFREDVDWDELEIVAEFSNSIETPNGDLLRAAYDRGKGVITVGNYIRGSTETLSSESFPFIQTTTFKNALLQINPVNYDTPLSGSWTSETYGISEYYAITAVRPTAMVASTYLDGATTHPSIIIEENATGGRWAHFHIPSIGTQAKIALEKAVNWVWNYQGYREWEISIGEYVIDQINDSSFPHQISLTGRDYTKKCMISKFEKTTSFAQGTKVIDLVAAIAANVGIHHFNLPSYSGSLTTKLDVERGTVRWEIMKQVANSHNLEIFFDSHGSLVMREFLDPVLSPVIWSFKTGQEGNLIKFNRSTNDSRLFNHIVVYGEREGDDNLLPFFGEARNNEPSSPTRIDRIGDRYTDFTSSFFTSNQQCQELANAWLKIHSLESYEIDFESLNYPWLEVGNIINFFDPERRSYEPTRYLLDTLTIPLSLAPMTGTGKRVTIVQDIEQTTPLEGEFGG